MTNIVKAGPPGASRSPQHQPTSAVHRLLVALELIDTDVTRAQRLLDLVPIFPAVT